ncbi:MAG: glycoside hydrolase family 9 protein [Solirubrobacteraceae bacterium]
MPLRTVALATFALAAFHCASLAAPPDALASGRAAAVAFRFNQVGYPTAGAKQAFAMTGARVRSPVFLVRDASQHVVMRARAGGPVRWNAGRMLYKLSLTGLHRQGRYTIVFAGARSPAITLSTAAALYGRLAGGSIAMLQQQRDGPETISGPLRRLPSHLRDSAARLYGQPRYRGTTLLGGLASTGTQVDASGGWFDAGDYLKFVETASFADAGLLFALRSFPAGVPAAAALGREARFGTDWLLKMWDQNSRVLYYQVGIGDGNGGSILGDHDLWRLPQADDARNPRPGSPTYFESYRPVFAANAPGAPISPNLAGRMAAAFGLCAQVYAAEDPAYAARCLVAGQTIYDLADTTSHAQLLSASPHAYYNETEWRDDMEFGAAELYLATQQALAAGATAGLAHTDLAYYLQQAGIWANAYIEARASGQDSLNVYDVSSLADYDLVRILRTPTAAQLEARPGVEVPTDVASLIKDRGDQLRLAQRLARREPFGLANPATNLDTVAHALGYAVQARMFGEMTGSRTFAAFSQSQLNWVLGANAWGSSFVVGYGNVFPHCLAAQIPNLAGSLDGRGRVLVGATVDGPTAPSEVARLELPEGARRCPHNGRDPFAALNGHGLAYLDDVRSSATSEPTDDLATLTLLAGAQAAAGG